MGVEIPLVQHSRYHIPPSTGHSLIVTFSVAFGIQLLAYIVSSVLKTERLYDLSGTLTYVACTLVALLWRQRVEPLSALGFRQILCASCVLLWSLRLGFFLYKRVLKVEDKRFDKFKITPLAFIIPFSFKLFGYSLQPFLSGSFFLILAQLKRGIPILEASSQRRYGDRADYQIYVARTSTLFPWPPRKAAIASSSVSDRTIQIISQ
ncbi:hypothetical protein BASA60_008791 [Batrachochytrium salamandrivorans]|nr:hypothetical protein BASA60_008791 [Batrachochytrium salamandrivorans]